MLNDETGGTTSPRLFIEDHLPVAELGIESVRERAAASALPPLYFLHVWWARRPLVASSAAVLAGLLPAWSPELPERFTDRRELADPDSYRSWFLELCGIWGDPVRADALMSAAKAAGTRIPNQYTYKQAYKNSPSSDQVRLLHGVLETTWGCVPSILDPTAGGGSIPFSAIRYRLTAHANDLNAVAAGVLRAGVALPARYGLGLQVQLKEWGEVFCRTPSIAARTILPVVGWREDSHVHLRPNRGLSAYWQVGAAGRRLVIAPR